MDSIVAETTFDCVDRGGRSFALYVRIGDVHDIPTQSGDHNVGFYVELDPLMKRRLQAAPDSFTALCFCIEMVRKALRIFVAHGGCVYFTGTRSPIDIDSHFFEPHHGLICDEYLNSDSDSKSQGD